MTVPFFFINVPCFVIIRSNETPCPTPSSKWESKHILSYPFKEMGQSKLIITGPTYCKETCISTVTFSCLIKCFKILQYFTHRLQQYSSLYNFLLILCNFGGYNSFTVKKWHQEGVSTGGLESKCPLSLPVLCS